MKIHWSSGIRTTVCGIKKIPKKNIQASWSDVTCCKCLRTHLTNFYADVPKFVEYYNKTKFDTEFKKMLNGKRS